METKFESIEGRSLQYYFVLAVLAAMALAGLIATFWVINKGIWVTGMTQRVPWGLQIVMAVYYIGLSAGSLVISGLYGVFGKAEYKPFAYWVLAASTRILAAAEPTLRAWCRGPATAAYRAALRCLERPGCHAFARCVRPHLPPVSLPGSP